MIPLTTPMDLCDSVRKKRSSIFVWAVEHLNKDDRKLTFRSNWIVFGYLTYSVI